MNLNTNTCCWKILFELDLYIVDIFPPILELKSKTRSDMLDMFAPHFRASSLKRGFCILTCFPPHWFSKQGCCRHRHRETDPSRVRTTEYVDLHALRLGELRRVPRTSCVRGLYRTNCNYPVLGHILDRLEVSPKPPYFRSQQSDPLANKLGLKI